MKFVIILYVIFSELFVARIGRKESLVQSGQSVEERGVSSSMSSTKSTDNESPPNDLLCPLCKRVYFDAVITPCCNLSFCDECKMNKSSCNVNLNQSFFSFFFH